MPLDPLLLNFIVVVTLPDIRTRGMVYFN